MADPVGRFSVAFDDPTLEWDATWTRLDDEPSLITSYTIDRGRQYELDRTDTGRATVEITDRDGILDPTNSLGPYYGKLEPLRQAAICRWNPITEQWFTRYRGFIEDFNYGLDPSQRVNRLQVSLIDIFEILSAVEMLPGVFGDTPPTESAGQVFFDNAGMDDRIIQVLTNAQIPTDFYVVFSGNVTCFEHTYSPGDSAMSCVLDAVDAEFPAVSNVFGDRLGRLAVHGRLAKFDPVGVASGASPGAWDWHHWHAGDGTAVNGSPTTMVQVRELAFNRGLSKVINQAWATPKNIADEDNTGQIVEDAPSIASYGIRSWSAEQLLTKHGFIDDTDAKTETKRFAEYYIQNYAQPRNRITAISFRSLRPTDPRAAILWNFLSHVDISDLVDVTVGSPGGGGFTAEPFFVEGVHEEVRPLHPDYDDVTLRLDLSPQAYFTSDPWAGPT